MSVQTDKKFNVQCSSNGVGEISTRLEVRLSMLYLFTSLGVWVVKPVETSMKLHDVSSSAWFLQRGFNKFHLELLLTWSEKSNIFT